MLESTFHRHHLSPTHGQKTSETWCSAQLPPVQKRSLRARPPGFYKCGRRSNCALCQHSENASSYTSSFTHRLAQHVGSATQDCQVDTVKPVGRHFRLPGHKAYRDLVMLPIEVVSSRDPFLLKARETYNIMKFSALKGRGICEFEHGLNLDEGQV